MTEKLPLLSQIAFDHLSTYIWLSISSKYNPILDLKSFCNKDEIIINKNCRITAEYSIFNNALTVCLQNFVLSILITAKKSPSQYFFFFFFLYRYFRYFFLVIIMFYLG